MATTQPIVRTPLRETVHQALALRIQVGDIAPGARLKDTNVALELGVSRTPVREAMLQLEREGVLEADQGRGFRVRQLSAREIGEAGAILVVLEAFALRISPDLSADQLVRLEDLIRQLERTRGDLERALALDDEWHQTLLAGCPNARLLELLSGLREVPRRYLHAYLRGARREGISTLPHTRILEALRRGEREAAIRLLSQRWERGVQELEAWLAASRR
jgi:DNA-binding GntR family transcriptional regulator